jgi:hypothetical protein
MRFAFYNRVCAEDQQDPEQLPRCRALIEAIIAKYVDTDGSTYLDEDGRESPYRRTTNQPEPAQEKPPS